MCVVQVESELHKDHVVSQWQVQEQQKKQVQNVYFISQHLFQRLKKPASDLVDGVVLIRFSPLTPEVEEEAAQERRRFENEYERSRREALERMKEEEERRKEEERERAEFLRQQMEELKLRDEEVS